MEPISANSPSETTSTTNKKLTFWSGVWEWVKVIVIALLISLPIRFFIAEPFIVNGASMDPTFATGQFLIVDRLSYRFQNPSRGDVIVFEYPNDPSTYYIKRIIGLPGETIDIIDGRISVSGSIANNSATTANVSGASTTSVQKVFIKEPYVADSHRSRDTLHVILGSTEYFVMGDNRLESSDSRVWGPLDKHFIVGRPIVRLYPIKKVSVFPGEFSQ